jgi:hypothetical protein
MDLFGNVEQLFVREADHRSAHEGSKCKPVARIRARDSARMSCVSCCRKSVLPACDATAGPRASSARS